MHNKRSYAMRGAVPVLFSAHLVTNALTRQVSASNPALRIPPTVSEHSLYRFNILLNRKITIQIV